MRAIAIVLAAGVCAAVAAGCADGDGGIGGSHGGLAENESHGEGSSGGEHHGDHDEASVSPEAIARVQVLESTSVGRPTEVLGVVDVHEPVRNTDEALHELREHAAALGADAVLGVEFRHGDGHGEAPTHLSGLAVRFRRACRDAAYDVVGPIEVREPMGHDEQAMADMRRRLFEIGADCAINVAFEHGDAESDTIRVHGTAIRYR